MRGKRDGQGVTEGVLMRGRRNGQGLTGGGVLMRGRRVGQGLTGGVLMSGRRDDQGLTGGVMIDARQERWLWSDWRSADARQDSWSLPHASLAVGECASRAEIRTRYFRSLPPNVMGANQYVPDRVVLISTHQMRLGRRNVYVVLT